MKRINALAATLLACLAFAPGAHGASDPPPPGANDFECAPGKAHPRPVVLVHGLGATRSANWGYHAPRIAGAGYCVFALTYGQRENQENPAYQPGGVQRMEKSSKELKAFVARVLRATDARKVDLVGHSEGTVMPRYYLERRGGAKFVKRFVALTPLWRGTNLASLADLRDAASGWGLTGPLIDGVEGFCASCPQFLRGSEYLDDLNADGEAIPGIAHTNIVTEYDQLVRPPESGLMRDGGTNIVLQDLCPLNLSEHLFVAFDPVVTQLFLNALDPRDATPVSC
ncbi:MAG: lipase family protein [Actinomycetota bacterium]|nr:lipase family protein [Actinomycetota bacterium]